MKLLRKYCAFWAIGLSWVGILGVCCGLHFFMESQYTSPKKLLYETDHQAVLDACRDLMARHKRGEIPNGLFRDHPDIPDFLRPLRPGYIYVHDDVVTVEMHGASDHYGFFAYAEGSMKEGREGGQKLIDGLWWYGEYP